MSEQQIKQMYMRSYPNPFEQMLRQTDSLGLSNDVADSIAILNKTYGKVIDSIWTPVVEVPRRRCPEKYDLDEAYDRVRAGGEPVARQDGDLRSGGEGAAHRRADSKAAAVHRALPRQPGDSPGPSGSRGRWTRWILRYVITSTEAWPLVSVVLVAELGGSSQGHTMDG